MFGADLLLWATSDGAPLLLSFGLLFLLMVLFPFSLIFSSFKSAFLYSADLSKESLVKNKQTKKTKNKTLCESLAFSTLQIIQGFYTVQTTYLVAINNKVSECVCVCFVPTALTQIVLCASSSWNVSCVGGINQTVEFNEV